MIFINRAINDTRPHISLGSRCQSVYVVLDNSNDSDEVTALLLIIGVLVA